MRAVRQVRDWVPAVVVAVLVLVVWQQAINVFDVQRFLLPRPTEIWTAFWEQRSVLWDAGFYTFSEAVWGFLIGSTAAVLAALVLARLRPLGNALMPYLIAANASDHRVRTDHQCVVRDPEPCSKIAIAGVLCFFPVLVNTLRGLTSVRPESIELMRSYAASERGDLPARAHPERHCRSSSRRSKVASVLAMIGAVIGDYFGGSLTSLGIQIKSAAALMTSRPPRPRSAGRGDSRHRASTS